MDKKSRIILCGPGGSGKDFLRKKFESRGYKYCVSYTSRPPRIGEKEGYDYKFTNEEFFEKNKEAFYETAHFNSWWYGTSLEDFYSSDLFIMTPSGIKQLRPQDRETSMIVYLNPPEEIRKERLAARNDADTVDRRLEADHKDFSGFLDYDIMITNEDF